MAKKITSFEEFAVSELQDTYSAENQVLAAFPDMIAKATSPELKKAFEMHAEQTKGQIARLEQILKKMGKETSGNKCEAAEGLIKETKEALSEIQQGPLLDAALIASAQRFEHYEIASYGTSRTYAEYLGDQEAVQLLEETLKEEEATDKKLTKLAETNINLKAIKQ